MEDERKIAELALVVNDTNLYNKTYLNKVIDRKIGIATIDIFNEKLTNNTLNSASNKEFEALYKLFNIKYSTENVSLFKQIIQFLTGKLHTKRITERIEAIGKDLPRNLELRFKAPVPVQQPVPVAVQQPGYVQPVAVQQPVYVPPVPVYAPPVPVYMPPVPPVYEPNNFYEPPEPMYEQPPLVVPPQLITSLLKRKNLVVPIKTQKIGIQISDLMKQR